MFVLSYISLPLSHFLGTSHLINESKKKRKLFIINFSVFALQPHHVFCTYIPTNHKLGIIFQTGHFFVGTLLRSVVCSKLATTTTKTSKTFFRFVHIRVEAKCVTQPVAGHNIPSSQMSLIHFDTNGAISI
jgi:hypothetical protein